MNFNRTETAPGLHRDDSHKANAPKIRVIAFYLPQFHPVPENDSWWGKGFTEWTNVAKAEALFAGHFQPRLPGELGFYDLRLPEVREAQAQLAQSAGVEGFCYYHYWFAGKQLLERPLKEVVESGSPALPFCICWANQTWSGIWHGNSGKILIEQTYPGATDDEAHFMSLLPAFRDPRYIKIDGRLSFTFFRPKERPNSRAFFDQWQRLASIHGLSGFHFTAHLFEDEREWDYRNAGFDAAVIVNNLKAYRAGVDFQETMGPSKHPAFTRRAMGGQTPNTAKLRMVCVESHQGKTRRALQENRALRRRRTVFSRWRGRRPIPLRHTKLGQHRAQR